MKNQINVKKTGYERTGFEDIHICLSGAYSNQKGAYSKGRDDKPLDNKMIEACTEWIRKYMKPYPVINFSHSSYSLKHMAEDVRAKYVSNGAFAYAAIKEGYEYILPFNSQSLYFGMVSTPNAPDGLFERIEKEAEDTCIYKRLFLKLKKIFGDELSVSEIPEFWNDRMEQLLGVRPTKDSQGVLVPEDLSRFVPCLHRRTARYQ